MAQKERVVFRFGKERGNRVIPDKEKKSGGHHCPVIRLTK